MHTVSVNPAHCNPDDKILINEDAFTVERKFMDARGRYFLVAVLEGKGKVTLEYYQDQIKVNKIIG